MGLGKRAHGGAELDPRREVGGVVSYEGEWLGAGVAVPVGDGGVKLLDGVGVGYGGWWGWWAQREGRRGCAWGGVARE